MKKKVIVTCFSFFILIVLAICYLPFHFQNNSANFSIRPFLLMSLVKNQQLKQQLWSCKQQDLRENSLVFAHRGASIQFPEHTKEAYIAAASQGAAVLECDVVFTKDKELVCRHADNDLHMTTNILETPLASKCTQPFQAAVLDNQGNVLQPAKAECRTTDITLTEFKSLKGKPFWANHKAQDIQSYMYPSWRNWRQTFLYAKTGTLMTHAESIALFRSLNKKMIPELKQPKIAMPFDGFTDDMLRQKVLDEYQQANVAPQNVFLSSSDLAAIQYWLKTPNPYQAQITWVDVQQDISLLPNLKNQGVNYIAAPISQLLQYDNDKIEATKYATTLKQQNFQIIAWTLETSGFYQKISQYELIDYLLKQLKVFGIFTDWSETVTYYGNCLANEYNTHN